MTKQSLKEWQEEAVSRFGTNARNWAFVCPACGKVSTVSDFLALEANPQNAYQECIGRVTGQGAPRKEGNPNGCNWAAYGFFGTCGKGRIVIDDEGSEIEVFDFAEVVPGDRWLRYRRGGESRCLICQIR